MEEQQRRVLPDVLVFWVAAVGLAWASSTIVPDGLFHFAALLAGGLALIGLIIYHEPEHLAD